MLAPQIWCLGSFTAVEIVGETLQVAALAPMIGEKVRREKGAGLQRVQVPPGNWFAPPGSNRNGSGGNEAVGGYAELYR